MWKNKKFIIVTALIAVLLIGGTTGTVLAWDNDEGPYRYSHGHYDPGQHGARMAMMFTRLSEILDVDQQVLEDAFKQVRNEMHEEFVNERLQTLVDNGTIAQNQADEFTTWLKARPDIPMVRPQALQTLVDDGTITQKQADEYTEWLESRPDMPCPQGSRADNLGGPHGFSGKQGPLYGQFHPSP